ncbi:MAG: carboxypeptidase regulatory-like domain-containing protein [Thermoanaerobaculia bacterium]|nr:carboxypeptidase regulatory-like domain-containing protein [Thermoanaerobaculia bacterium]
MRIRTFALSLAGASLLASSALAGTITGTVVYDDKVPNLRPLSMDADPACAEKHDSPVKPDLLVLGDGNTMANVFVKVTNPPETDSSAPTEPVVIDQVGCMYEPHVVGVRVGQPLQFRNSDGILHNVHGLPDKNREFNLGMPASLKQKETTFNEPEEFFPVKCDVHPWMKAYVAVMTHPFFDVTDKDGKFTIDGLPDGTYTVEAWHEKLGTRTQEISVSGGEGGPAEFTFQVPK